MTFSNIRTRGHFAPDHGGTGILGGGAPPPVDATPPLHDQVPGAFGETPDVPAIPETEVAARAYEIWDADGRPNNRADDHWRRAEEDLRKRRVSAPDIGIRQ